MKLLMTLIGVCLINTLLALNPVREYEIMPDDFGMEYQEIFITTEDGVKLYGWNFSPMKKSFQTMIVCDDAEGNMADNIEIIAQFLSLGYNVIAFDYRGYGKSEDFRINDKFFIYAQFGKDVDAVINWVKKYNAKQKVSVYGLGIGGGLALSVSANNLKVSNVIADSPYSNLEQTQNRIEQITGVKKLMPLGFDKNFLEPTFALQEKGEHLEKVMFIVGEDDQIVSVEDIKALEKLKKKNTGMYVVPGVDNKNTFNSNKNEYFNQIKKFLTS